ncbi:MAG: MFS transporter [Thermoanaerobaculia bacterium]|nr:MFS transporter [Thermoanaerobaculia bacterium]
MRGYVELLRSNRDFRLFYLSSMISLGGDWFLTVAMLDLVLELTGSATLMSIVIVCQSLPIFLITPFAGHLIDSVDRRKLMVLTDIVRAGAALLPLAVVSTKLLPLAYFAVVVIALGAGCFQPAAGAALPNLVSDEELPRASVLFGSLWGAMLAIGAAIGGLVSTTLGRNASFMIDSLTFLVSALLLYRVRTRFSAPRETDHVTPPFFVSLKETVSYSFAHPRVLAFLSSKSGFGIAGGVVAMLSIFGREIFAAGAFGIGLLFSARGLGALLGPFVVRALSPSDEAQYRTISLCIAIFGLGYIALTFSPYLWLGFIAVLIGHMGGGGQWLTSTYGLQREVPDRIRGRVMSADFGLVTLTISISSIVTGLAADAIGAQLATAIVASISLAFGTAWWWFTRGLWVAGAHPASKK